MPASELKSADKAISINSEIVAEALLRGTKRVENSTLQRFILEIPTC